MKDNNDTWTDSSRRNNIWSSFSSTDLHLGFLHHLFNMSNHIHLTIHLNQYITYIDISIYQLCKTNPYLGPLLVSANCCWSSMNRFNLVHTACTFNTDCTFTNIRAHTASTFHTACTLTDIRAHTDCIFKKNIRAHTACTFNKY